MSGKRHSVHTAEIVDLSHDGRGVARVDGAVVFIADALPGETVLFEATGKRRQQRRGELREILSRSVHRTTPRCFSFGVCGGCALQHLEHAQQTAAKQKQLLDNLQRIGKVVPHEVLAPIAGPHWGYRRRARLGVRYVPKKGGVLVGFRERHKSFVTPLRHCHVLHPRVSGLLPAVTELVGALSCRERLPQIEVAVGDATTAMVFRHLVPLNDADLTALTDFGAAQDVVVLAQSAGVDSLRAIHPLAPAPLHYRLDAFDVNIYFGATDFVQVNGPLNEVLVQRAVELLRPGTDERVLELFCGLGNFSLPIARSGASVLGLEGDSALVHRARENARRNALLNAEFLKADLYSEGLNGAWLRPWDKLLLDPPRTGAVELVKRMDQLSPRRIVYVSCNPATLSRDAGILVHQHGYRLVAAGIVDMFPHTAHVESIAVFERNAQPRSD